MNAHEEYIENLRSALQNRDEQAVEDLFEKILYELHDVTVARDFAYWPAAEYIEHCWDEADWDDELRSYGLASELTEKALHDAAPQVNKLILEALRKRAIDEMRISQAVGMAQ